MASYRRVGRQRKWQAEVLLPIRLPNGRQRRATRTHPSKGVVKEWATRLEAQIDTGVFVDPAAAKVTLAGYYVRWVSGRVVSSATLGKTGSHWRNHVEPEFGGWPLSAITRPVLRRWVKRMADDRCPRCLGEPGLTPGGRLVRHDRPNDGGRCSGSGGPGGLGPWTIQGAVSTLSTILSGAVDDGLLTGNPTTKLKLPRVDPKPVFYWTHEQARLLVEALPEPVRLMVDLDLHVGLRWGELAGLKRRFVDLDAGLIQVVGVATRAGWREYPKSRMSRRPVPVPRHLRAQLAAQCEGLDGEAYVFPAPDGGAWDDTNFRARVFRPACVRAGVPVGTPHDMRHTAASWLVQADVDLYRVQALLGHESFRTTARYAHLAPGEFEKVLAAWG